MRYLGFFSRAALIAGTTAILLVAASLPLFNAAAAVQADPAPHQIDKLRSQAESQHEIVIILIKKKSFDQALIEANKIFGMKWPADQEPVLLKDLLLIADQFLHSGQAGFGIKLIDANIKAFRSPASQASIWKEKGYLYKSMGDSDRALECFRQAQKLEK